MSEYKTCVIILSTTLSGTFLILRRSELDHHHHHHLLLLPPWIKSLDLFRHRRVAIFSRGVHDLFFL